MTITSSSSSSSIRSLHQTSLFPSYPSLHHISQFRPPPQLSSTQFPFRIRASSAVALEPVWFPPSPSINVCIYSNYVLTYSVWLPWKCGNRLLKFIFELQNYTTSYATVYILLQDFLRNQIKLVIRKLIFGSYNNGLLCWREQEFCGIFSLESLLVFCFCIIKKRKKKWQW